MNETDAIGSALAAAGIISPIRSLSPIGGGCIHRAVLVTLEDERRVVAKINAAAAIGIFQEETRSLERLAATGTVVVPRPLACAVHGGRAVLAMTAIAPAAVTEASWRRLGLDLAALHRVEVGPRYGFDTDNHLGATHQPNGWCDDWVEFNATHRIGHQLALARAGECLGADECRAVEEVVGRMHQLIPRRPRPALIHGDLWSGNALPTEGDRVAVIDPACSIGDGWADIAMMRLFGGFAEPCFSAYTESVDDADGAAKRIDVYQLYHLLNHVNLFGAGYVPQAMAVVARLT